MSDVALVWSQGFVGQVFGEPSIGPDETSFQAASTGAAYDDSRDRRPQAVAAGVSASPFDLAGVFAPDLLAGIVASR